MLDRAHVVQAIRELDRDHARIVGHRHDHLAVVVRLGLLAGLELDPRQLRHPLDQLRDLAAELGAKIVELDVRVLDHVVQKRCSDRLLVEAQLRQELGHRPRVPDELLARPPELALVRLRGVGEGPPQQLEVCVGVRLRDGCEQLVDEVFVLLGDVDDRHFSKCRRGSCLQRIGRSADEQEMFMRRFRKIRRDPAREIARALVALDRAAAEVRPQPRRRAGVSVAK